MAEPHLPGSPPVRSRLNQDQDEVARRARFIERSALFAWIFVAWAAFAFWAYTLALDARAHFESLLTTPFRH